MQGNPHSEETRAMMRRAATLVKDSVHDGRHSFSHRLAFSSGAGWAHIDTPGIAEIWRSQRTIGAIIQNELRIIGRKLGLPEVHSRGVRPTR